jgi:hypothetical protein
VGTEHRRQLWSAVASVVRHRFWTGLSAAGRLRLDPKLCRRRCTGKAPWPLTLYRRCTTWRLALAIGLLSSVFRLPSSVLCFPTLGRHAVSEWTADGDGLNTGGVYTVNGTVGQPDAGPWSRPAAALWSAVFGHPCCSRLLEVH